MVAACGAHVYTQGAPATLADCAVPSLQMKAPTGTTITGATIVDASKGLPKFCQVDGHTATPGNEVNFRLGLPERWNGKYYFVGVGGLGGTIGSLNKTPANCQAATALPSRTGGFWRSITTIRRSTGMSSSSPPTSRE